MEMKRFPGKPDVYVLSGGNVIEVTTSEHMRNENRPLKEILTEICEQTKEFANKIFHDYDYPDGKWFPCGSADIVLKYNDTGHREIINLFKKEADQDSASAPNVAGRDWYVGWFGRLFKTDQGWWWMPKLDQKSQSMLYEEDICRFIREKLAYANIKVEVRTYID